MAESPGGAARLLLLFGALPLIGMGMSPIIGAWLGVGLLAALLRRCAP